MSKIQWKNSKHEPEVLLGQKGNIVFCIDKIRGNAFEGFRIRIVGMGNITVRFFRENNPIKTISEAKIFCQKKLREHIKELEATLSELKK